MLPIIALVGRPNVGKSTLFNRLTKSRDALVADMPGVTRDRLYGHGQLGEISYLVVDSGGIERSNDTVTQLVQGQVDQVIAQADIILFIVDAQSGLLPADREIAKRLRRNNKTVYLVVNKIDGLVVEQVCADFYQLGFSSVHATAATHGRGVVRLINHVLNALPKHKQNAYALPAQGITFTIIGRPNVGKSTLANSMLGEQRLITSEQEGTTRDSISINFDYEQQRYALIDTAGIRRRSRVHETVEKFSVIKSLQAIDRAQVVIVVFDAKQGLVEQDLHLLNLVIESGRALVIAINKWDGLSHEAKKMMRQQLARRLSFVDFARQHFISAKYNKGVRNLFTSIQEAHHAASQSLSTSILTRVLQQAIAAHPPPRVGWRQIKLRYAHPTGNNPPVIAIHGKQTNKLPDSYRRYLLGVFRKTLKLIGTPIRLQLKTDENPYVVRIKGEK